MHEINLLLADRLKTLGASQLPSAVLNSMQADVQQWERELVEKAASKLRDRVQREVTKPWISRHFSAQFRYGTDKEASHE